MHPEVAAVVRAVQPGRPLYESLQNLRDLSPLLKYADFSTETYRRVLLHPGEGYELRLLCWKKGQSSSLHGHGSSDCALRVVSGAGSERVLDSPTRRLKEGSLSAASRDVVHQVWCESQEMVTLHAYRPALPVDQPSSSKGHRIAIVGGGFSGVAAAIHLLNSSRADLRISIIEPGPWLGRGLAFGAAAPGHLLNVPASQMSLFPERPDDFVAYAKSLGRDIHPDALLPRRLYGAYVVDRLGEAIRRSPGKLRVIEREAIGLDRAASGWTVGLSGGETLEVDDVIVATGNDEPRCPPALDALRGSPALIANPWEPGAIASIHRDERVLLIGTGLTALDVLVSLETQGHRGGVTATSRRGLWPRPHLPEGASAHPYAVDRSTAPNTADALARWFGAHRTSAQRRGHPWQSVVNAVRSDVSALWAALPAGEKTRFLERYWRHWEVLRHRAPRPLDERRRAWVREGYLQTVAGELTTASALQRGAAVEVARGPRIRRLQVDRVVLCSGADPDVARSKRGWWSQLLAHGLAVADPHRLGIATDDLGRVITRAGGTAPGLWAIGALRRPQQFESTAVPDLSRQAARLARDISMGIEAAEPGSAKDSAGMAHA